MNDWVFLHIVKCGPVWTVSLPHFSEFLYECMWGDGEQFLLRYILRPSPRLGSRSLTIYMCVWLKYMYFKSAAWHPSPSSNCFLGGIAALNRKIKISKNMNDELNGNLQIFFIAVDFTCRPRCNNIFRTAAQMARRTLIQRMQERKLEIAVTGSLIWHDAIQISNYYCGKMVYRIR